MSSVEAEAGCSRATHTAFRPSLRLVTTPPERPRAWVPSEEDPIELKLGFRQLDLVYRSLDAVRTLGLVERQDELLTDTLELIDAALQGASDMSIAARRRRAAGRGA